MRKNFESSGSFQNPGRSVSSFKLRKPFRSFGRTVACARPYSPSGATAALLPSFGIKLRIQSKLDCALRALARFATRPRTFFVHHVRGNAVLRLFVHLLGADLDFDNTSVACKYRRVQAFVAVWFWEGDIVFNFIWQWLPEFVYEPEHTVAIGNVGTITRMAATSKTLSISPPFRFSFCHKLQRPLTRCSTWNFRIPFCANSFLSARDIFSSRS